MMSENCFWNSGLRSQGLYPERSLALGRVKEARKHLERRGFARPILTNKTNYFSWLNLK